MSLLPCLTSLSLSPSVDAADASSVDVLFDRGMVGVLVDKCLKDYVHNVALSEACLRTLVALAGAQRARRRLLHMGTVFRVTTALQVRGGHKY
jgi:ABC-type enterochelin transport system permease subunit